MQKENYVQSPNTGKLWNLTDWGMTKETLHRCVFEIPCEHFWKAGQTQSGTSLSFGPTWWPVAYPLCPLATLLMFMNLVNEKHRRAREGAPVMCTAVQMGRKLGIMYLILEKWQYYWKRIKNAERKGLGEDTEFWKQETTRHNTDQWQISYSYT